MKKIVWVTSDYFLDNDLRPSFLKKLCEEYSITWIVLFYKKNRYKESDFQEVSSYIDIRFHYLKYNGKDFRLIFDYLSINKIIKEIQPDIIYLNTGIDTPFFLPLFSKIDKEKLIVTAHQGYVHNGMDYKFITKIVRRIVYDKVKYVHMFTESQAALFKKHYHKPDVFVSHLALREFGEPSMERSLAYPVRFLVFGIINYAKHIDLLIEAACRIYEEGTKNFKVIIKGGCDNWSKYQNCIKYPELFDIDIRLIDNSEIPNLFASSHFLVQPYRILTQSGPTKIAFRYNTPIIASDLPGFREEIFDGVNGYLFKEGDLLDLSNVMKKVISEFSEKYPHLSSEMKLFTDKEYSEDAIVNSFKQLFRKI